MSERRYSEQDVARIFERATEAEEPGRLPPGASEGLTLAELHEIGKEVGIPPERLTRAARSLATEPQREGRRLLGLPIGVARTVELPRPLTDEEWHRLVVDLRETFDARGKLRDDGPFKQWTNGNLEALLEPTATGQRLRLRTTKGSALQLMAGGLAMLGISMAALIGMLVRGDLATRVSGLIVLVAIGLGMIALPLLQLPSWARTRRRQMERIAERVALMTAPGPEELGSGSH